MALSNKEIAESIAAFVPPATESYTKMISDTVSELKAGNTRRKEGERKLRRPFAAAAIRAE